MLPSILKILNIQVDWQVRLVRLTRMLKNYQDDQKYLRPQSTWTKSPRLRAYNQNIYVKYKYRNGDIFPYIICLQ